MPLRELVPEDKQAGGRLRALNPGERGGAGGSFSPGFSRTSEGQLQFQPQPTSMGGAAGVVAGGASRAVKGVTALPFDIAGHFGVEGADRFADIIRKNIPEIPAGTTGEDMLQTLVQYGVPSATVMKLTGGVLSGVPKAIQITGEVISTALADVAVSDPVKDKTLGDLVGGPTKIQQEDSMLERRLKIGAESGGIGATLIPVGVGLKTAATKLKEVAYDPLFGSATFVDKVVRDTMRGQALDPNAAIREIDKSLKLQEGTNVRVTTGPASKDAGVIGMEKAVANQPPFVQRTEINQAALGEEVEKFVSKNGGDPNEARMFYENYIDELRTSATGAVERARKNVDIAKAETDALVTSLTSGKQAEASLIIDDVVRDTLERLTSRKNSLYAQIDPNRTVEVDRPSVSVLIKKLLKPSGPLDTSVKHISPELRKRLGAVAGWKNKKLYYRDLVDLRSELSDAIQIARKENRGSTVNRLVEFKEQLYKGNASALIVQGGDAGAKAQKALDFYNNTYTPAFRDGVGDLLRRSHRGQAGKIPGTAVASKFISPSTGAQEAAQNLNTIIKQAPSPEIAEPAVRDFIISEIAGKMQGMRGKTSSSSLNKFLGQRRIREALDQFPNIKREVYEFKNNLEHGVRWEESFGGELINRQNALTLTEKDIKRNAASYFVSSNPADDAGRALRSSDPVGNIDHLVKLAKQDPSGNALKGLRAAMSEHIQQSVQGLHKNKGVVEISHSKINKLLKNKTTRRALGKLYSSQDMAVLDGVNNTLELMFGINKKTTAGSPTQVLGSANNTLKTLFVMKWGLVKGPRRLFIFRKLQDILGINPAEKVDMLLQASLLDPELGRTMLTPLTPKTESMVAARLSTYLLNNMNIQKDEQNQGGN